MLIACIRGKVGDPKKLREDFLTSAVFGLLKYFPPSIVWPTLLAKVTACRDDKSVLDYAKREGLDFAGYESVDIRFWERKGHNEPDMVIQFKGPKQPTLQLITEVKLRSLRNVRGKDDQLGRYMRLLGRRMKNTVSALVYITPDEVKYHEDLEACFHRDASLAKYEHQVFRLYWPDLGEAIRDACQSELEPPYNSLLTDLDDFFRRFPLSGGAKAIRIGRVIGDRVSGDDHGNFVITVFPS